MATKKTKAKPKAKKPAAKTKAKAKKPAPKAKAAKPTPKATKPAPKQPPAAKPAPKAPAVPSIDEIIEIYEGHGKIFENVFTKDTELIEAFLAWGQAAHPRWWDEVVDETVPMSRAIRLETLIYDEENEAESIAPFFVQLADALRTRALATLAAIEGNYADDGDDGD